MGVSYNKSKDRYELPVNGQVVYAACTRQGDVLHVDYVEAPPALRGTGAAGQFMQGLVALAREEHLKIFPICGYAASWMRRHPEHHDILKS